MGNLRVASSKSRDDYPVPLVYTVKGHLLVIVLYNIIDRSLFCLSYFKSCSILLFRIVDGFDWSW